MNESPWSPYVLRTLVLIVAVGVVGCESTTITGGPTPTKCELDAVGPATIAADGGTATISVSASRECAWDVSTQAAWISDVLPASGQGNGTVAFRAAPNPGGVVRESDIIINEERVRISQDAARCQFTVTPTDLTIVATGGTGLINVSTLTGCAWTAASDVPWVTLTSAVTGSGNGSISFSVASNTGMSRSGNVTIGDQSVTVAQSGAQPTPGPGPGPGPGPEPAPPPPCSPLISPTSQTIGPEGGAGPLVSVAAASGCTWTAVSNATWITVGSGAIGNGNGSVTFTVAANPGSPRNGTLTIGGQTFTVRQGTNCTYQLNGLTVNAPPAGGTLQVYVFASAPLCSWTATTTASWIKILTGSSTGSGPAQFVLPANTGEFRTANMIVAGYTVTVNQP